MPKIDGMTVLKQLRKEEWGKGVPVVILTNLNDASTVINALEFEIDDEIADMRAKNEILSPEMARKCIKRYLDMRLENGVEDFLIKTDCTLEEIVKKVKIKLGIR